MTRESMKNDVPDEWRRRQKAGLCPVCGKTKEEFDSRMRVFCTKKCREAYAEKYTFWSILREEILKRDDHTCVECGINSDKYRTEIEEEKKKRFDEWIKTHPLEINTLRDKRLVRLSEQFEEDYDRLMDDYHLADRFLDHEEKEELFKGLRASWLGLDFEVDHIKAVCLGGDMWDKNNLRTLCTPCHKKKTREDHKKRKLIDGQSNLNGVVIKESHLSDRKKEKS